MNLHATIARGQVYLHAHPRLSRLSRLLGIVAPPLGYFALSLGMFSRNVDWTKYYFGYSTDSVLFIWCLHWWPYALSHGLNPFVTEYVWFPVGYNLAWATSVPFYALLAWPVTMLVSPVLSYNILMLAAPALSAWAAFLLGRELTGSTAAALVCGVLFGFSAPELSQLLAQLNLDSLFLIPLAYLLCIRRLRGRLRRLPFVIWLSLLLAAQLGISTEILATMGLTGGLGWLLFLCATPEPGRAAFWRLAGDIGLCIALFMLLTAPFIYYLIIGLANVPKQIHFAFLQESDLLQFIFPRTPLQSPGDALRSLAAQFTGYVPGNFIYLGIPLLLMVLGFFWRNIQLAYAQALLALMLILAVLTLGLKLDVNGWISNIPMPWTIVSHIPVIRCIIPARFAAQLSLGTAIAAAFFLAGARTGIGRVARYGLAALACSGLHPARLEVLPAAWQIQPLFERQSEFKWSLWPVQPFFTPQHIRAALGANPNVLILPDELVGPGMAWQIDAKMGFTQAAGYIGTVLVAERKWDFLDALRGGNLPPDFATAFPAFCAAHRVDQVLIGPGTPGAVISGIEALGWPHHLDSGIEIIEAPPAGH